MSDSHYAAAVSAVATLVSKSTPEQIQDSILSLVTESTKMRTIGFNATADDSRAAAELISRFARDMGRIA